VGRRIEEEHLLDHDAGEGSQLGKTDGAELFGSGSARGQKIVQDSDDISITRDDPGVQIRIPMNGIFATQALVERIRVGEQPEARGGDRD